MVFSTYARFSTLSLLIFFNCDPIQTAHAAAATSSETDSNANPINTDPPFRHRNLDYWDVDTFAAYLSVSPKYPHELITTGDDNGDNKHTYAGNDAAVLLYAQWCNNCHSLAPMWDQIATLIHAGTTKSNVIMALFDCEQQESHKTICDAAGVTHYPTMLYIGKGTYHDTDPVTSTLMGKDKSAGPMGKSKLPHTVKFQGDWRYGEQIMDWITVMKGISSYSKWIDGNGNNDGGFLGKIAKWMIRPFHSKSASKSTKNNFKNDANSMAVGIPPEHLVKQTLARSESDDVSQGNTGSMTQLLAQQTKLEQEKELLKADKEQYEQAYKHTDLLLNTLLFYPEVDQNASDSDATSKMELGEDVFTILSETWDEYPKLGETLVDPSSDKDVALLQYCAVEMSFDYCTRFATKKCK